MHIRWYKKVGEHVHESEVIADFELTAVSIGFKASYTGYLAKVHEFDIDIKIQLHQFPISCGSYRNSLLIIDEKTFNSVLNTVPDEVFFLNRNKINKYFIASIK
jgi:hypothetical protein